MGQAGQGCCSYSRPKDLCGCCIQHEAKQRAADDGERAGHRAAARGGRERRRRPPWWGGRPCGGARSCRSSGQSQSGRVRPAAGRHRPRQGRVEVCPDAGVAGRGGRMSPVGKFSGHTNVSGRLEVVDHVAQRLVARQQRVDEDLARRCRSLMMPLSRSWLMARETTDWVSPRRSASSCWRILTRPPGSWREVSTSKTSRAVGDRQAFGRTSKISGLWKPEWKRSSSRGLVPHRRNGDLVVEQGLLERLHQAQLLLAAPPVSVERVETVTPTAFRHVKLWWLS